MADNDLRKNVIELESALNAERERMRSLRRVALRALAVLSAREPDLEGAVHDLTRTIEDNPEDTRALDRMSARLADTIRQQDQREDLEAGLLAALESGLQGFTFLAEDLAKVHQAAERGDADLTRRSLARVFSALQENCGQALAEREQLSEVMGEIRSRLNDVDSALSADHDHSERTRTSIRELHENISGDVSSIKGRVVDITDIDTMRREVVEGLDRVADRVRDFRDTREAELLAALERNRALRARSQELENQVAGLHERLSRARDEATRDKLTGLLNRHALDQRMAAFPADAGPASLIVWDIDHFKRINDEYGHTSGDRILKAVAEVLAERVSEPDFVARYGGEEFVMVMHQPLEAAREQADQLRREVAAIVVRAGSKRLKVTISGGLTELRADAPEGTAFELADKALLAAKRQGRDRIVAVAPD
ncbi:MULTISPECIES: GGDEF domain-containing protein [unclassified Thioalkalivibrio]|uniref:GGDEF domain-containing protein n=1 Tax=unclassified Thioalkalivibrio TaxID=2621013 RepID=UPI00036BDB3C|nr:MULTISPECIES: GGDEF domain-containing protein [unclassified Thioalkalivibrio]